jgi:ParB-like chromosome segregation protein Spo0J
VQQIKIDELKPHPRNNEFFDDLTGEKWNEFLESIKSRGVIEPIVTTQDNVIVSGHQRVKACKELGISQIMCDIHFYHNEDEVLQDLIETNIRQRGDIGGSAKKVGKRIKELERIYGIKHGGDRKLIQDEKNSSCSKLQNQLASDMNMDVRTLQNYKQLAEMIPELEDLVDTGIVTKTTALAIIKELSQEDQEKLISSLDTTKRITQKEMQKYIDKIKELEEKPPEKIIETIVQKPVDYDDLKKRVKDYKSDNSFLQSEYNKQVNKNNELKKRIEIYEQNDPKEKRQKQIFDSALLFCAKVSSFIEQVGGYVWLTEELENIPEKEREGYIKAIHAVKTWADTMEYNINNKTKEIN